MPSGHMPSKTVTAAKQAALARPVAGGPGMAPAKGWRGRTRTFGHYGVWAIPVFALVAALAPRSGAAFSTDPRVYARYDAIGRYETGEFVVTIALGVLGVIAILAMGVLLWQSRARRLGQAGLIATCLGAAAMLWQVSTLTVRADRLRHDLLSGDFAQIAFNAADKGGLAVTLALGGAVLLCIGWILYGIGVFRADGLNRADGVLLIISAPMLYLGGMVLNMIPVLGAFLLLAAGLGIGLAAARAQRGEPFGPLPPRQAWRQQGYASMDDLGLLPADSEQIVSQGAPVAASPGASPNDGSAQPDGKPREVAPQARKGWRSATSWTVSRKRDGKTDGAAAAKPKGKPDGRVDVPDRGRLAAPPPAPAAARNLKPLVTRRKSRNAGDAGASIKSGANSKSGNPPGASTNSPDRASLDGKRNDRNCGPV
jgi:hypothetical protein